ncbi:molecular chaperone DnaK [Coleofasciculus sp. FACHB-T130]|uniref:molecular chaperone DnaK n=1 Tax=Cyanophyceae TaxID=3028117 RepID=UPI001686B805|nr:molecular chaperone DnaK [Coleofasciculus sp. FACHB-T130]MBD1882392.1 molecular chaperone DnaK [Coleofasciculus sp. FACHB-T130]
MGKVAGISLGATNSCIAVMDGKQPIVITNAEGFRLTPCVVAYTKNGNKLIGRIAKRNALMQPDNSFYAVKRFIGRKYDEVIDAADKVSYQVLPNSNGGIKINCHHIGKEFTPEEISAQILRKLVDDASKYFGEEITQAVLTVPPYFNDFQRQAVKEAGKLANLEILRVINEPNAACLAYELDKKNNETILVFDLGGSTLDISVLEVGDGVFEVLASSSDPDLGGDNFDQKIIDWLINQFQSQEGLDLRQNIQASQRLTEAAEKAKIELSLLTQTEVDLPFITATPDGPKHLNATLTRTELEKMCSELLARCIVNIEQAIKQAKLSLSDINAVVLVGGSSCIPAVQDLVQKVTNQEPLKSINPDEAVAIGAAIQGKVARRDNSIYCMRDVTSLSLGIETIEGTMTRIIPRHSTIPVIKSQKFYTATYGQTSVEINILMGEREFAKDNKKLGILRLDGIPLERTEVQVTFDIDINGILNVYAKEISTGKEQSISIIGASTVPASEVERILRDAELNVEADRILRQKIDIANLIEARKSEGQKLKSYALKLTPNIGADFRTEDSTKSNDAYRVLFNLTNQLVEQVLAAQKRQIEGLLKDLEKAIAQGNYDQITSLGNELQQLMMQIGDAASPRAIATIDDEFYEVI